VEPQPSGDRRSGLGRGGISDELGRLKAWDIERSGTLRSAKGPVGIGLTEVEPQPSRGVAMMCLFKIKARLSFNIWKHLLILQ